MDAMNELSQHKEIPLKRVAMGENKGHRQNKKFRSQNKYVGVLISLRLLFKNEIKTNYCLYTV